MSFAEVLTKKPELSAKEAENLDAFNGFNLYYIRKQVEQILGLIGRGDIFDEYTLHDMSHIDKMLEALEWIIPSKTKDVMSPADWLLIVLSIYFHDMGMLVTKREFELREKSEFPIFKKEITSGDAGADLQDKLAKMHSEKREKFLYQEFVRRNHAHRIRLWIEGKNSEHLGVSSEVIVEIDKLLKPLGTVFRRDLALICESHHLDDLTDFNKYFVSKPYGNTNDETANLQYAAILLRTVDLLHITQDRTPSVAFNIINPLDPISQDEWAKQRAVRSVRPALGINKEGFPDASSPSDTIEIHASFNKKDGFFGLTSYLSYAESEMDKSYKASMIAQKTQGTKHHFPWRKVDQSKIDTDGFLSRPFKFELDQHKILDLLIGHTLYNDSSIVLRELIQNSLDAIRLQRLIDENQMAAGTVVVNWDSMERTLSVSDDGTGMTQDTIESFFLKAGASSYQDPKFKEKHPNFSPISRFGIGILSTFMIADTVDVITFHPDEELARHISLRSVHGTYLIELLDKRQKHKDFTLHKNHGTTVKLKVRPSVNMGDVLNTVKRWIVIPEAEIKVIIDGKESKVGYSDPKSAVISYLVQEGYSLEDSRLGQLKVEVRQEEINGVTVAYAVKWSDYFKDWSFLTVSKESRNYEEIEIKKKEFLGLCIEGIRVEFTTPGFKGNRILAIGNVKGLNGPKTNVARAGIENTKEYEEMLRSIYQIYCNHIESEMHQLKNDNFSITWVALEAKYLLGPLWLYNDESLAWNESILKHEIRKLPTLIVETNGKREAVAPFKLKEYNGFWTIQCSFYSFAESLVREVPGDASVSGIISNLNIKNFSLPNEPVLSGSLNSLERSVFNNMEVDKILVYKEFRRVDLHWVSNSDNNSWLQFPDQRNETLFNMHHRNSMNHRQNGDRLCIAKNPIECIGLDSEIGVIQNGCIYLLHGTELNQYCLSLLNQIGQIGNELTENHITILLSLVTMVLNNQFNSAEDIQPLLDRFQRDIHSPLVRELERNGYINELKNIFSASNTIIYDPSKWVRKNT